MQLASVRCSLLTNDAARSKFLAHLMTGTKEILQTGQGVVGLSYTLFCLCFNDIEQMQLFRSIDCSCVCWYYITT